MHFAFTSLLWFAALKYFLASIVFDFVDPKAEQALVT